MTRFKEAAAGDIIVLHLFVLLRAAVSGRGMNSVIIRTKTMI